MSKINPDNVDTRIVRFPLDDFKAIMGLSRINIDYMKTVTNSLLGKVINASDEKDDYRAFQLFKECVVTTDDNNEWYIEIDAHGRALPLLFKYKK